ncbi:hypothetical protein R3P38DRAFT_3038541 [Favolaschia claudopus]|uniref:Protein FAM72A n=1 Tax=Favolaschia claudopus TaxID=2862362 RepID=A0AAW0A9X8_9AGAR
MFSYRHPWHSHLAFPPANPHLYPPPPPPVSHKVWILDCKACGMFLTNRGMKAVLLLRPNVALYSSDALPVNCSAYTSNPQVLRPATTCPSSSGHAPRTCECLTQTLCCHGCGSAIGYMIVIPCAQCTSSISITNRSTNGHRFVFHSSEIKSTERLYVSNEPGVILAEAAPAYSPPLLTPYTASALHNGLFRVPRSSAFHSHSQSPSAGAAYSEYLPTPPLEIDDESPPPSDSSSPTLSSFPFDGSHYPVDSLYPGPHPALVHTHYPHLNRTHGPIPSHNRATSAVSSDSSISSLPPLIPAYGLPGEQSEAPIIPALQAGDVLYWHHLVKHGEIPGVMEDVRARRHSLAIKVEKTRMHFDR